jgi:hypothetical protein
MGGTFPLKYTRSGYCLGCCCAIPVPIAKAIMQVVIKVFMVLEFGGEEKSAGWLRRFWGLPINAALDGNDIVVLHCVFGFDDEVIDTMYRFHADSVYGRVGEAKGIPTEMGDIIF